jgi:hypothetical protein
MLKNISRLETKINEKTYQFLCDMDSALPEVKEALFQFVKYVGQIEDQIRAKQEQDKLDAVVTEDPKPE